MSSRALPHPDRISAEHWLAALARRFPDLLGELATTHRPTATGRGRASGRRGPVAPVRLWVSDDVHDITDRVVELEATVHDHLRLPPAPRGTVDVRLRRIAGLLDRVQDDPVLLQHVLDEAGTLALRCSSALGETEPVVRLRVRCPWCDSVSLRVLPARRTVLCINPACRCPSCDRDPAHRHSWAEDEWAGLAERCDTTVQQFRTVPDVSACVAGR